MCFDAVEPTGRAPPERGCEEEMASDLIQLEVEGAIAWVTLNRPKALNALSPELLRLLLSRMHGLCLATAFLRSQATQSSRTVLTTPGAQV